MALPVEEDDLTAPPPAVLVPDALVAAETVEERETAEVLSPLLFLVVEELLLPAFLETEPMPPLTDEPLATVLEV